MMLELLRRRPLGALLAVVAIAGASSCGGDGSDSDGAQPPSLTVRQTLDRALAAAERRDLNALCGLLSRKARLVIGHARHGSLPLECPIDSGYYIEAFQAYPNGVTPRIVAIERSGPDRAVATYALPDGMRAAIPLRVEDGAWKLDGFFDADLARLQMKYVEAGNRPVREDSLFVSSETPTAVSPDPRVTARDGAGRRCADVGLDRFPELRGGCVLSLSGRQRITLQTPFGFMLFAQGCDVDYKLRVAGDGRAWVDSITIGGPSPCLDMIPCVGKDRAEQSRVVPWQARVRRPPRGGGLRLVIENACFDTCIGLFKGRWALDLVESPRGWRASSSGVLGSSGMRVDGSVGSKGKPVVF